MAHEFTLLFWYLSVRTHSFTLCLLFVSKDPWVHPPFVVCQKGPMGPPSLLLFVRKYPWVHPLPFLFVSKDPWVHPLLLFVRKYPWVHPLFVVCQNVPMGPPSLLLFVRKIGPPSLFCCSVRTHGSTLPLLFVSKDPSVHPLFVVCQ